MKPTIYIMRGLPGSGKSKWIKDNIPWAAICSADHWFYRFGPYQFVKSELGIAHKLCFEAFEIAIRVFEDTIAIDNTNLSPWEYQKYVDLGKKNGYEIKIINIGDGGLTNEELAKRNVHGVPLSEYERLRNKMNSHFINL